MYATWTNLLFCNTADHTALSSFTSEASLLAGTNLIPALPPFYFDQMNGGRGKVLRFKASGVLGSTGTPTYLFKVRLGTTAGASDLSGTLLAQTAAITTGSGVSTKRWELNLDIICRTPGSGTNNCTLSCSGVVRSMGGFASPFEYATSPGGGESGTWTATINSDLTQYLNLSVVCSASDASNTITCKEALLLALN